MNGFENKWFGWVAVMSCLVLWIGDDYVGHSRRSGAMVTQQVYDTDTPPSKKIHHLAHSWTATVIKTIPNCKVVVVRTNDNLCRVSPPFGKAHFFLHTPTFNTHRVCNQPYHRCLQPTE